MAESEPVARAVELIKVGKKQEARTILVDVLKRDRDNAKAWASICHVARDRKEAEFFLQQVLRLKPGNEWALEHLERLKKEALTAQLPPKPAPIPVSSVQPSPASTIVPISRVQEPPEPASIPAAHAQQPIQVSEPSDALIAAAQMKDFTTAAVLTFFLYALFFIPGLVFNIMYLNEAARIKRIVKRAPTGMGCLQLMLFVNLGIFVVVVFVLCVLPTFGLALAGGA